MANTDVSFQELRFNVRNPEYTDVYVFIEITGGEYMGCVQGWHYKRFPADIPTSDIFQSIFSNEENALSWPFKKPEQSEEDKAAEYLADRERELLDAASKKLLGNL